MRQLSVWFAAVAMTAFVQAAEPAPWPAPTPDEIRATIQREMEAVYLNPMSRSLYGYTVVKVTITEPIVGELVRKNLSYENAAQPVWPVTTVVTATAERPNAAPTVEMSGEGETWYFFKTDGVWTYRLGS